jgi:glycosyltransferase involved in cell wall biosynthesis
MPREAMRVLFVTNMWPRPDRPGFGSFVHAQAESLRSAGVNVHVFTIAGDRGRLAYLRVIPALRREVHRWRPHVVHAHFGYSGFTASFQPVPLVVSFCGDDLLGTPGAWPARIRGRAGVALSRFAASRAAAIICKSANLVHALPHERDRHRAHVIPNGVDFQRFAPGDRAAARRRLGLPAEAELVIFPHDPRQAHHKGFALASEAMARLSLTRPSLTFQHVSGRPHREMPDWFRAADCMLLTSISEGSPNVVKEALATGCPVVSVRVGDVERWLLAAQGCALVERDAGAVAAGVGRVLDIGQRPDPDVFRRFFDSAAVASQLVAVYRGLQASHDPDPAELVPAGRQTASDLVPK